jgi:endonuclease/exonuclease/phosphatase (EEP) superfamily protein YafD
MAGIPALNAVNERRRWESRAVSGWIAGKRADLVAGDFNMPQESRIYWHDWSNYQNAFGVAGLGYGYSKYTRWHGVRIDHVLADEHWRVESCKVEPDVGSDHRPVLAELRLKRPSKTAALVESNAR